MTTSMLFQPLTLAGRELPNRIVMAPMTRARSSQPSDSANALMAEFDSTRLFGGDAQGYCDYPAFSTAAQVHP